MRINEAIKNVKKDLELVNVAGLQVRDILCYCIFHNSDNLMDNPSESPKNHEVYPFSTFSQQVYTSILEHRWRHPVMV